jgi:toxin ParE1/3/4
MSVRERNVRFTSAARRDLRSIALYTLRVWGIKRQSTYRTTLESAFTMLHGYPSSGRTRDDLFPGCRSLQIGQHVIYYHQPDATTIVVQRILHSRQDAGAAIDEVTPPYNGQLAPP